MCFAMTARPSFLVRRCVLVIVSLWAWAPSAHAQPSPVAAQPADRFVESVGVNVHFDYPDTAYYTRLEEVRAALCALGVRHVRQGVPTETYRQTPLRSVARECGVRVTVPLSPLAGPWPAALDLNPAKTRALLDAARTLTYADETSAVEAFEGPNEYDASHGPDPNWQRTLRQYQRMMYGLVNSDSDFSGRPVLAPSFAYHQSTSTIESFPDAFDVLNMHPYPGGGPAGVALAANLASYRAWAPSVGTVVATETGYHNALGDGTSPGGYITQPGVPEVIEARYLPRLFMESLRQGVTRTFTYELLDLFPNAKNNHQESNFGLLRNDLTEKMAYRALQNTLTLFADPGPSFEAGSLGLAVENAPADVRWLLFETRDGRFLLALWREVRSYEIPTGWRSGEMGLVLDVPTASVTVRLAAPAASATVYLPSRSADPVARYPATSALDLNVPDELLVVEIEPGGPTATTGGAPETSALITSALAAPNPFRDQTTLAFALAASADVSLEVFDVLGRRMLAERRSAPSGTGQRFVLDARVWAPGTYLAKLTATAGGRTETVTRRITVR